MAIDYIGFAQLILAMLTGSFLGLVILRVVKDIEIWCLIQSNPDAIAVFYKGRLVKSRFFIESVKLLRSIVLKIAK